VTIPNAVQPILMLVTSRDMVGCSMDTGNYTVERLLGCITKHRLHCSRARWRNSPV